jgi:hypothetical protein
MQCLDCGGESSAAAQVFIARWMRMVCCDIGSDLETTAPMTPPSPLFQCELNVSSLRKGAAFRGYRDHSFKQEWFIATVVAVVDMVVAGDGNLGGATAAQWP